MDGTPGPRDLCAAASFLNTLLFKWEITARQREAKTKKRQRSMVEPLKYFTMGDQPITDPAPPLPAGGV